MRTRFCTPLVALLITAGCHPPLETKEHHIVHQGEPARLTGNHGDMAFVALSKGDTHRLAAAVYKQETEVVKELVTSGKALRTPAGTPVRVTGESFNERKIEIVDGPHKGRTGWVPFEWLEPRV
jgi:hypothetical protein